ncbi:MAG: hypothetical protein U0K60_12075, partial [Parafannyhessea umbonata]|nr:hypothetical protein [Parafannyhessea umbonata]
MSGSNLPSGPNLRSRPHSAVRYPRLPPRSPGWRLSFFAAERFGLPPGPKGNASACEVLRRLDFWGVRALFAAFGFEPFVFEPFGFVSFACS